MSVGAALKLQFVGSGGIVPFGTVPQGVPWTLALSIKNVGDATLVITAIKLTPVDGGAGDFVVNNFVSPLNVAPGVADESVTVTFTPTSADGAVESATLDFTSNSIITVGPFTLTGTCSLVGSGTNVNASGNQTSSAAILGIGSNTVSSAGATFAATVVPPTAQVKITAHLSGDISCTPPTAFGKFLAQYSVDSGANWTTFYGVSSSSILHLDLAIAVTIVLGGIADLSTLRVRAQSLAESFNGSSDADCTATIDTIVASITGSGSPFVQVVQVSPDGNAVPAVCDYGNVTLGSSYLGNTFNITNPTSAPLTVTLTPDTADGFGGGLTGTNPVLPNNGSTLTFASGLTVLKGGTLDFPAAYVITLTGVTGEIDIEALYTSTAINPAFILVGDVEQTVLALGQVGGTVTPLYYFDPTIECEDLQSISKQLYIDQPHLNKCVNRIFIMYERNGPATLACSVNTINPDNVPSFIGNNITLDTETDGKLQLGIWSLQITGTVIDFTFSVTNGIASIVGFLLKVDEIGEAIENT